MDYFLFNSLNQWAGRWIWLDIITIFFAGYLEYALMVFFLFWLLWQFAFKILEREKINHIFLAAVFSVILSRLIITELIRFIYYRPRPFISHQVYQLLEHQATASFPSGHAAFYFAFSAAIYLYNKKIGLLFFIASFLITLSRIFTGIHYPLDILAGLVVGLFSAWVVGILIKKFKPSAQ